MATVPHQVAIPAVIGAGGPESLGAAVAPLGQLRDAVEAALQTKGPHAGVATAPLGTRLPLGVLRLGPGPLSVVEPPPPLAALRLPSVPIATWLAARVPALALAHQAAGGQTVAPIHVLDAAFEVPASGGVRPGFSSGPRPVAPRPVHRPWCVALRRRPMAEYARAPKGPGKKTGNAQFADTYGRANNPTNHVGHL